MIARWAKPGAVDWIGCRPARRADMEVFQSVQVSMAGLDGDRGKAGKRAVTLIQAEHLPAIAAYLGMETIAPSRLRRNIVVSGLNLASLKGRQVRLGSAVVELSVVCAPCSRMEEEFGSGGYAAVRGHGGWCAQVIEPGFIAVGDRVEPL